MLLFQRPRQRALLLVVLACIDFGFSLPFLSPQWPSELWLDTLAESLELLLISVLFCYIPLSSLPLSNNHSIEIGLLLYLLGAFHDVIDEFFIIAPEAISFFENNDVIKVSALILICVGGAKVKHQLKLRQQHLQHQLSRYRDLSRTDALTGLENRGSMDEFFAQIHQTAKPYAIWVIDVDNFKQLNDRYGHPIGDEVLKQLAQVIASFIEDKGRCFRFGGEEFVIYLAPEQQDNNQKLAQQLCRQCRFHIHHAGSRIEVTSSIGVAEHLAGEPPARTLARADQALYQAKRQGKDRVCFASNAVNDNAHA